LSAKSLTAGYGKKEVVKGVSLDLYAGEIVALIGHNGAGKSTLLKAIFGMIPLWEGEVRLDGRVQQPPAPRAFLRAGVAYVPQGNRVFTDLTVRENLEIGGVTLPSRRQLREAAERVLALFPPLRDRLQQRAGTLSGGEKQMVALANAYMVNPRALLLDEPSLGLAPPLVTEALQRIQSLTHDARGAALIVEQKVREVLKIADRVIVMRNGGVSYAGLASSLHEDAKLREVYL
jgi:branched-chain amino acid transport system ATP-binding protein